VAKEKSGYGREPVEIFPKRLKTKVKTIIVRNGWRSAHAAPRTVCL
jgi:hypothetical protein